MAADPSPLEVRDRLDEIIDPCSEARGTDISRCWPIGTEKNNQ